MTEKEKMLAGELYYASDEELTKEHNIAQRILWKFNNSPEENRSEILKELFGSTGENFCIKPNFRCDYGYNISIGKNFFTNHNTVILDGGKVTFGDNVFIAPNCGFYTAGHPIDSERRNKGLEYAYPITVGNNVWIGAGVQVMPGVTIGNNVVIGGGSVVVKDIPSNSVAVGNPCKVIHQITDEDKKTSFDKIKF